MELEQSDYFGIWAYGGASTLQIPIDAEAGKKFFRFKKAGVFLSVNGNNSGQFFI